MCRALPWGWGPSPAPRPTRRPRARPVTRAEEEARLGLLQDVCLGKALSAEDLREGKKVNTRGGEERSRTRRSCPVWGLRSPPRTRRSSPAQARAQLITAVHVLFTIPRFPLNVLLLPQSRRCPRSLCGLGRLGRDGCRLRFPPPSGRSQPARAAHAHGAPRGRLWSVPHLTASGISSGHSLLLPVPTLASCPPGIYSLVSSL